MTTLKPLDAKPTCQDSASSRRSSFAKGGPPGFWHPGASGQPTCQKPASCTMHRWPRWSVDLDGRSNPSMPSKQTHLMSESNQEPSMPSTRQPSAKSWGLSARRPWRWACGVSPTTTTAPPPWTFSNPLFEEALLRHRRASWIFAQFMERGPRETEPPSSTWRAPTFSPHKDMHLQGRGMQETERHSLLIRRLMFSPLISPRHLVSPWRVCHIPRCDMHAWTTASSAALQIEN